MTALFAALHAAILPAVALQPAPALEPGHVVRSVLHDAAGNYWFGTWNSGVYRFDGRDLRRFTTDDGLANNQVRTVLEDADGTIWFETASGISRLEGDTICTVDDRDYTSTDDWRINPGDLWFKADPATGVSDREGAPGVYRHDGTTLRYHVFPIKADRGSHAAYSVTGIDQRGDGRVWVSTYGAVFGFDGKEVIAIDDDAIGLTADTGFLHARCVFEDSTGRLWIGNNGIGVIMRDGDTTVNFTQSHGVGRRDGRSGSRRADAMAGDAAPGEPSMHRVFSIGEDRDGNIWFGTVEQGAWRFDGTSLRQFTGEDGLHTKQVMSIHLDRNGDLWLGGDGVYLFNGTDFERRF